MSVNDDPNLSAFAAKATLYDIIKFLPIVSQGPILDAVIPPTGKLGANPLASQIRV